MIPATGDPDCPDWSWNPYLDIPAAYLTG